MKMQQYLGKKCKLHIFLKRDLFYTATITDVTPTHISFLDRHYKEYTFRLQDVVQISGVEE